MPDPIPLHGTSLDDGVAAPGEIVDEKALAEAWQISRCVKR